MPPFQIPWQQLTPNKGFSITAITFVDVSEYETKGTVSFSLLGRNDNVELTGDEARAFFEWYLEFTGQNRVKRVQLT